jgi:hypothetical protein
MPYAITVFCIIWHLHLMHCTLLCLDHLYSYTLDHVESETEI